MSSLRVLLGSSLSTTLKRRLGVSSVTSTCRFSSYHLSQQFHSRCYLGGAVVASRRKTESNFNYGSIQPFAKIHGSNVQNRNEARIDDSLNRLDVEIRKVGRIRRQEVSDILADIKELKKATSNQSLMIIRCCGELIPEESPSNRTELVQQVWKTLETLKVPMDVSHYNALLRVYLENEHKFNPTEFLQNLTSKGIEPNRVTYQRLIARFCQDGDIEGASTILQHMKEKQMPINEYVFNSLILGHGQANDMESAEGILGVMRQASLEPNDDTYVTLMTCYAKQGDIANIHRIVKECTEKEVFLIDRDFLSVIHALAGNNHHQLIDEILPYLKKHSGFNQEATNLIFKLINIGQEDVAYKILKQMVPLMRQEETVPSGNFFIKHLVQCSRPSEMIVKYCKALQEEGLHKLALSKACEAALTARKFDLAVDLFEALKIEGFPIRQHYFWPFFASATSEKEVNFGLKCMEDLGLSPSVETLREYIIPNILAKKGDSFENSLKRLSTSTGIPMSAIAPAAMIHLLYGGDMDLAANLGGTYRLRLSNQQLRRAIVETYLRTNNSQAFVKIILSANQDATDDSAREYVGMILMDLAEVIRTPEKKEAFLLPVLKGLHNSGLGLSNSGSELLQNSLGDALTPNLANAILLLTSPELTPKLSLSSSAAEAGRKSGGPQMLEEKSTSELERMLENALSRSAPSKSLKKALLYSYCRDKNIEKAVNLREELKKEDFVLTPGLHAMFLELYVLAGKLEGAKEEYNELQSRLDFKMDDLKLLRYASLLQSTGDLEGCISVVKNTPRDESRKPLGAAQQAVVWKLLNSLAESTQSETVKEMFLLLKEKGLSPVNSVTYGPIIKSYLLKEDLSGALAEFERCVHEYKITPFKQELFCRFIKSEDADRLQKVMDLSTSIHGEVNSMYDLVFAFIDCGKVRQAKKILETPGLRARNDKIEMFCQRYSQDSKVAELENLIQVTRDLIDIDRNSMYFYLLQAYCKLGDPDKALSVWTSMQEENIQPSVELLIYLADFLRKNDRPIPFIVPDSSEMPQKQEGDVKVGLPKSIVEFRNLIDINDIDKALQIKQRMEAEGSTLSLTDLTALIDRLAKAERLNEATRITEQLFDQGLHPLPRTLRFLIGRLGSAGDVNALERINDKINNDLKRRVMFNSRLCLAYTNSNRGQEFFENYIKPTVETASGTEDSTSTSSPDDTGEEPEEIGNIPVFGTVTLFIKNKHLVSEAEELAMKASALHRRPLYNALWGFYMNQREFERAREIWNNHLKDEPRVLFRTILMEAKTNKDVELAKEISSQLRKSDTLMNRVKALSFSCALDVFADNDRVPEALEFLEDSLKTIQITDYPVGVLLRLKEVAEGSNLKFPHAIPVAATRRRNLKNDSSDSDSD